MFILNEFVELVGVLGVSRDIGCVELWYFGMLSFDLKGVVSVVYLCFVLIFCVLFWVWLSLEYIFEGNGVEIFNGCILWMIRRIYLLLCFESN